jgi:hypothetical protein
MVWVPDGDFVFGSTQGYPDERPASAQRQAVRGGDQGRLLPVLAQLLRALAALPPGPSWKISREITPAPSS